MYAEVSRSPKARTEHGHDRVGIFAFPIIFYGINFDEEVLGIDLGNKCFY
jgi:hypothetical protein